MYKKKPTITWCDLSFCVSLVKKVLTTEKAGSRHLPFPSLARPLPQSLRARSLVSFVAVLCTGPSVFWFWVSWDWAQSSRTVGPWTVQHWRSTGYSQTWISWFPESESTGIYRDTRSSSKVKKRGHFKM